jgi:hypothetical protein
MGLSTLARHDGVDGSVSLGLTMACGLRPSPLQLAGVRSAGTLLGGGNAPQYNHLGSTQGHTHDSTFVSVEC